MTAPYRADQVGSFLRPAALLQARSDPGTGPECLRELQDGAILEGRRDGTGEAAEPRAGWRTRPRRETRGSCVRSVQGLPPPKLPTQGSTWNDRGRARRPG